MCVRACVCACVRACVFVFVQVCPKGTTCEEDDEAGGPTCVDIVSKCVHYFPTPVFIALNHKESQRLYAF